MKENIKNKFIQNIGYFFQKLDMVVLIFLLIIIGIGIAAVISTSVYMANRIGQSSFIYVKKMFVYIPIGLFLLLSIQYLTPKQIRKISIVSFIILTLMLFLTLLNPSTKGANRWIDFKILKIQPSEFLKPIFAIIIAMIFTKIKSLNKSTTIKTFFKNKPVRNYTFLLLFILLIVLVAVKLQKDFSMFITYAFIFSTELFLTGINLKYIYGLTGIGIGAIIAIVKYVPHVAKRVADFQNGSYQAAKGILAIENSNLFFGGHDNNLKQYIPELHTDFIFTGIIEETGGIFAIGIMLIFLLLILYLFMKIYKKTDKFTIYSCVGILSYFSYQIIVHIASNLGLMPIDGITLPFISYGGSSFISSCIGIGILLSLLKNSR